MKSNRVKCWMCPRDEVGDACFCTEGPNSVCNYGACAESAVAYTKAEANALEAVARAAQVAMDEYNIPCIISQQGKMNAILREKLDKLQKIRGKK
jgi:hypothetical protein